MTIIYVTKGIEHDERNPPLQKHLRARQVWPVNDENAFLVCRQGCLRSQAHFLSDSHQISNRRHNILCLWQYVILQVPGKWDGGELGVDASERRLQKIEALLHCNSGDL